MGRNARVGSTPTPTTIFLIMKFLHFKNEFGNTTSSITTDLGILEEVFDGVYVEMSIINGKILFSVVNKDNYTEEELNQINSFTDSIDWDNGYEFFNFIDTKTNIDYFIEANKNSKIFDLINSPKNKQNISNFLRKF